MSLPSQFDGFPIDGQFWFIKWIDEFALPNMDTKSPSVRVILQKLPISTASQISRITKEEVKRYLGQRSGGDPEPIILPSDPRVLVGNLPAMRIGAIYKDHVHVGDLPTSSTLIEMPGGEALGEEVSLSKALPPPHNWTRGEYRLLNKFEYSVVPWKMKHSKCFVYNFRGVTYIIPRMTIFKAFYARHTLMANAFCSGSWNKTKTMLMTENDLKSGLRSEITPDGKWNIVLHTLLNDPFACWVALFNFDEYATACANQIYSKGLQELAAPGTKPHWYASAQIPFKETEELLRMEVRGFNLREWSYYQNGEHVSHKKFLVTEISRFAWPEWIPVIGYGRMNSGDTAEEQVHTDLPAPYRKKRTVLRNDEQRPHELESGIDPAEATTPVYFSASEWGWLKEPKIEKMVKKMSQTYRQQERLAETRQAGKISTGIPDNRKDAVDRGIAEVINREAEKRFDHLLAALEELRKANKIDSATVLAGTAANRHGRRGNLNVWQFFFMPGTPEQAKLPARSWRYVHQDQDAAGRRHRIFRTALVIAIVVEQQPHYWIEIECRKSEAGYRSILLGGVPASDVDSYIIGTMETVADQKGRNMEDRLYKAAQIGGIQVGFYRHQYLRDSPSKSLDTEYLLQTLKTYQNAPRESSINDNGLDG